MSWGSNSSSNKLLDTFVKGFLDISGGDVLVQTGNVVLYNTADATNAASGVLQVSGGASVAKSMFVGTNMSILGTTDSNDTSSGALQVLGGAGVAKNLSVGGDEVVGGNVSVGGNVDASSTSTGALQIAGGVGVAKKLYVGSDLNVSGSSTVGGNVVVSGTTDASSTSTGALQVAGGVGVAKKLFVGSDLNVSGSSTVSVNSTVGGNVVVSGATDASSTSTGALQVAGGVGVAKKLYVGSDLNVSGSSSVTLNSTVGGNVVVSGATDASSTSTGALQVAGGVGVAKKLYVGSDLNVSGSSAVTVNSTVGGNVVVSGATDASSTSTGALQVAGGVGVAKKLYVGSDLNVSGSSTVSVNSTVGGNVVVSGATDASSTSTGALQVAGGVGVAKKLYVGSDLNVSGSSTVNGSSAVTVNSTVGGNVSVNGTTDASTTSTGALQVAGGVGIAKKLYVGSDLNVSGSSSVTVNSTVGGNVSVNGTTDASSTSTGALQVAGGVGVAKKLYVGSDLNVSGSSTVSVNSTVGGNVVVSGTTDASSTSTGALQVAGGVGVAKKLYVGSDLNVSGSSTVSGSSAVSVNSTVGGNVSVNGTTDASTTSTGALQVAGGVGIAKKLYVGSDLNVYGNASFTVIPTAPTADMSDNSTKLATTAYVRTAVSNLIGGSPDALDTLNELAAAIADDASYSYTVMQMIGLRSLDTDVVHRTGDLTETITGLKTFTADVSMNSALRVGGAANFTSATFTGQNVVSSTAVSTSTSTGALLVSGGVGVGGNLFIGGDAIVNSTKNTSDISSGALVINGGAGIAQDLRVGGTIYGNIIGIINSVISSDSTIFANATIDSTSTGSGALIARGGVGVGGNLFVGGNSATSGNVVISSTTVSTTTSTGALRVSGGVGVGGNLFVGGNSATSGNVVISSTTVSTTTSTGALRVSGGVGVGGNLFVGGNSATSGNVVVSSTTVSTTTSTGALQVAGGVGVGGNLFVGGNSATSGNVVLTSTTVSTSTSTGALQVSGGVGVGGNLFVGGNSATSGNVVLTSATVSTSTSTGALRVSGGVGVGGNLFVGGNSATSGNVVVSSTAVSTTTSTGALRVSGGVGIGGDLSVGGKVGLGIVPSATYELDMSGQMRIFEAVGTTLSSTAGSLVFEHGDASGQSSILFRSKNNAGNDYAYIQYQENVGGTGAAAEKGLLTIGIENDVGSTNTSDRISLFAAGGSGFVGVNTKNPTAHLDVSGSVNVRSITASTSTASGALVVSGGVGVVGNLFVGGNLSVSNGTIKTTGIGLRQPPSAMTSNVTNIPGHGTYYAYCSSTPSIDGSNSPYFLYDTTSSSVTTPYGFSTVDGSFNIWAYADTISDVIGTSYPGYRYHIDLPYQIILSEFQILYSVSNRIPVRGSMLASNDGINWNNIYNFDLSATINGSTINTNTQTLFIFDNSNNTSFYSKYALVVNRICSIGGTRFSIRELFLFGKNNILSAQSIGSDSIGVSNNLTVGSSANIYGNLTVGITNDSVYNNNSSAKLLIVEPVGTVASATSGSLVLQHADASGASSIVFMSKNNSASDYAYIQYQENVGGTGAPAEKGLLTIGIENDVGSTNTSDRISLFAAGGSGFVGVNTKDPTAHLDVSGSVNVSGATASTTTSSGALVVSGGVGVGGNLFVGGNSATSGNVVVSSTTVSTTTSSGALVVSGGVGVGQNLSVGGKVGFGIAPSATYELDMSGQMRIFETVGSVAGSSTGSLVLEHGDASGVSSIVFRSKNGGNDYGYIQYEENVGGTTNPPEKGLLTIGIENNGPGNWEDRISLWPAGGSGFVGVNTKDPTAHLDVSGSVNVSGATASTTTSSGALVVSGGVGVGGNLFVGGNLAVTGTASFTGVVTGPTATAGTTTTQLATTAFVRTEIAALVDSAPDALNTLNELAAALGDNANFATTITESISLKANTTDVVSLAGVQSVTGVKTFSAQTIVSNATVSTTTSTGALVVSGGVGVGGNLFVGGNSATSGNVVLTSATVSTTTSTGALQVSGGVGVGGNLFVGGNLAVSGNASFTGVVTGPTATAGTNTTQLSTTAFVTTAVGTKANTTDVVSLAGSQSVTGAKTFSAQTIVSNTTVSTTTSTGALVVSGGVGVGGNLFVGGNSATSGNVVLTSTTVSTTTSTGALQVSGGVGVGGNLFVGGNSATSGNVVLTSTTVSTSTSTGALRVSGGVGVGGNLFVGGNSATSGNVVVSSTAVSTTTSTGALRVSGGVGVGGNLFVGGNSATSGNVVLTSATVSTSTSTGALQVSGGVGVGGNLFVGGNSATSGNVVVSSTTVSTTTSSGALVVSGGVGVGQNLSVGGKVGLGIVPSATYELDMSGQMRIYETVGTTLSSTAGSLVFEHGDASGQSSILFRSKNNAGNDFAYIQYQENVGGTGAAAEKGLLTIGIENESGSANTSDRISLFAANGSGFVGVNTKNPTTHLDVSGSINISNTITTSDYSSNNFIGGNVNLTLPIPVMNRIFANTASINASSVTISGITPSFYNGVYDFSASSFDISGQEPHRAFDETRTTIWMCDTSGGTRGYNQTPYSLTTPFAYRGGTSGSTATNYFTTLVGGQNISGEWLQIKTPTAFNVTSYSISKNNDNNVTNRLLPSEFYLAGSNDGTNWTQVDFRNEVQNINLNVFGTVEMNFTINKTSAYTHFRLITTKVRSFTLTNGTVGINDFRLFGEPVGYSMGKTTVTNDLQLFGKVFANDTEVSGNVLFRSRVKQDYKDASYSSLNGFYALDHMKAPITNIENAKLAVSTWSAVYNPGFLVNTVCWSSTLRTFCAVGTNKAYTSPDGMSWTVSDISSNTLMDYRDVVWAPELGIFCAVGGATTPQSVIDFSRNLIATSTNGVSWNTNITHGGVGSGITAVAWSPELRMFNAIGTNGANGFLYSYDGINWTSISSLSNYFSVVWAADLKCFVFSNSTSAGGGINIGNSSGTNVVGSVVLANAVHNSYPRFLIWSPELKMLVAHGSTQIYTSYDGYNWTTIQNVTLSGAHAFGAWSAELGMFLIIDPSTKNVYVSSNGISWSSFNVSSLPTANSRSVGRRMCWSPELGIFCFAPAVSGESFSISSLRERIPTAYNMFGSSNGIQSVDQSGNLTFNKNTTVSGSSTVSSTTVSTTTSSGALVVSGGVGVGGNLFVGGNLAVTGTASFTGVVTGPTATAGTDTTQLATTAFVRTEIAALVDSAPDALNTLNELAAALGDDVNFATTITESISLKAVDTEVVHKTGGFTELIDGDKTFSGVTVVLNETESTSTGSGALQVTGGVGVGQNLSVGGKVGFGIVPSATYELDMSGQMRIFEDVGTTLSANAGSLVFEHGDASGQSSILFRSKNNAGNDFAYIQYQENVGGTGAAAEKGLLTIGIENESGSANTSDRISLFAANGSGFVGVNTKNPTAHLDVSGSVNVSNAITTSNYSSNNFIGGNVNLSSPIPVMNRIFANSTSINASTVTISGITPSFYNGVYDFSASSFNSTFLPHRAFDNNFRTFWRCNILGSGVYNQNPYSNIAPYSYQGGTIGNTVSNFFTTSITNGMTVSGEWIQIQTPVAYGIKSFSIKRSGESLTGGGGSGGGIGNDFKTLPSEFYLLGSTTGTNWDLIDFVNEQENIIDIHENNELYNYTLATKSANYSYFRFVITKLRANNLQYVAISDIELTGEPVGYSVGKTTIGNDLQLYGKVIANNTEVNGRLIFGDRSKQDFGISYSSMNGFYALDHKKAPITDINNALKAVSTWTPRYNPGVVVNGICWSSALRIFCAVGTQKSYTSPDGINWTENVINSNTSLTYRSVVWAPELNLFCAIASGSTAANTLIAVSSNGTSWNTNITHDAVTSDSRLYDITWSPELRLFNIVGHSTSGFYYSSDGYTWTKIGLSSIIYSIVWASTLKKFFAIGNTGAILIGFGTSVFNEWLTLKNGTHTSNPARLIWSSPLNMLVAYGSNNIFTSYDGVSWTMIQNVLLTGLVNGTWSDELGIFCLIDSSTPKRCYISNDGITWTSTQITATITNFIDKTGICWSPELGIFCVPPGAAGHSFMTSSLSERIPTAYNMFGSSNGIQSVDESGNLTFNKNTTVSGSSTVSGVTASTSTVSGALVVSGGVGVGGNLFVGGNLAVSGNASFTGVVTGPSDATDISSNRLATRADARGYINTLAGSVVSNSGNESITGAKTFTSNLIVSSVTVSTTTSTGALVVSGGVGVGGNLFVGGNVFGPTATAGTVSQQLATTEFVNTALTNYATTNIVNISTNQNVGGEKTFTSDLIVSSATVSTSSVSGALRVSGGVGVGQNLSVGGKVGLGIAPSATYELDVSGQMRIFETVGSVAGSSTGSLILEHGDASGVSSIVFRSKNGGNDYGYIQYEENVGGTTNPPEKAVLTIGIENNGPSQSTFEDIISLWPAAGTGRVGINTKNPTEHLDVSGDVRIRGRTFIGLTNPGGGGGDEAYIEYKSRTGADGTNLSFVCNNDSDDNIVLLPSGSVGIKTSTPNTAYALDVSGNVNATSYNASSDYRIKENVVPLDLTFNVDVLKPVSYNLKGNDSHLHVGFIAHEVQEFYPFLVNGVKDGASIQSINYIGFIGILTKEIQLLKRKDEENRAKLDAQESRIKSLEDDVAKLLSKP